jgi:hypothetical protein
VLEGIFEIRNDLFIIRIRRGIGHDKDFLVSLARGTAAAATSDLSLEEIGLRNFAEFNGCDLKCLTLNSLEDWETSLADVGADTEKFLLPYLFGERDDYEAVEQFVDRKTETALKGLAARKYPPNVIKKWD